MFSKKAIILLCMRGTLGHLYFRKAALLSRSVPKTDYPSTCSSLQFSPIFSFRSFALSYDLLKRKGFFASLRPLSCCSSSSSPNTPVAQCLIVNASQNLPQEKLTRFLRAGPRITRNSEEESMKICAYCKKKIGYTHRRRFKNVQERQKEGYCP